MNERTKGSKGPTHILVYGMDGPWKVYFELPEGREDDALGLIKEFTDASERAAWYFHPNGEKGKGPHYHGLLVNYSKSDDTARLRIKKVLGLNGRTQEYAVSDKLSKKYGGGKMNMMLTPTYITYMSKGKFEPVMLKGYEKDEIDNLKTQWTEKEKRQEGKVETIFVKEKKEAKITQWEMARQVQGLYMEQHKEEFVGDGGFKIRLLIECAIKVLKEHKKLAHKRMVANLVQDVMAEVNHDEYIAQIYRMI